MSQIQRSQTRNDSDSQTVALNVSSGFSEPIALTVPRAQLERPFRQLVQDAIRAELSTDPAAHLVETMLGQPGVMIETRGRYHEPDTQTREVVGASDQEHVQTQTVHRLMARQSGGARGSH